MIKVCDFKECMNRLEMSEIDFNKLKLINWKCPIHDDNHILEENWIIEGENNNE